MIIFNNSYARLPERFYQRIPPRPVEKPTLIHFNSNLARENGLDIDYLTSQAGAEIFAGNRIPEGAEPIALAYAGHQFGHFVPQLGDGRAVLLGEIIGEENKHWDIQLKGSGPTAFSRNGDGRAALGPIMREYILSEAIHRLGIRTNRSLAMVTTGESVFRETKLPGAILTRFSSSHVRVGTFEYFRAQNDIEALKLLADYVIDRLYPHAKNTSNPYLSLFKSISDAQASLVSSWMNIGFIHGVMNTDNMAISGETIDYGPCAFMDTYDHNTVYSSIDRSGRYSYGNQGNIAHWNLTRLAECLLSLLDTDENKSLALAKGILDDFPKTFHTYWLNGMRAKLGFTESKTKDQEIIEQLLGLMQKHEADYTLTFRYLSYAVNDKHNYDKLQVMFSSDKVFTDWLGQWHKRLAQQNTELTQVEQTMLNSNPAFIPRNHQVEAAINLAIEKNDFSEMTTLMAILSHPYIDQPDYIDYMQPPKPDERIYQTFCGT
jgi:uncharacterized protein YdiU (UPF0061 family)